MRLQVLGCSGGIGGLIAGPQGAEADLREAMAEALASVSATSPALPARPVSVAATAASSRNAR